MKQLLPVSMVIAGLFVSCATVEEQSSSDRHDTLEEAGRLRAMDMEEAAKRREKEAETKSGAEHWTPTFAWGETPTVSGEYYGTVLTGFSHFPRTKISVSKAIDLARPYLKKSSQIRNAMAAPDQSQEVVIQVSLQDDFFAVINDAVPPKIKPTVKAVRVDINTGKVYEPR